MRLHFTLINTFVLCLGLMLWQHFIGYTLLAATGLIGGYFLLLQACRKERISPADWVMMLGFLVNLWYIVSLKDHVRQYDYYNFHMLADYWARNNFFIGHFRDYWSEIYFQPPLWGIILALPLKFLSFADGRFFTFFAVCGTEILFWRLSVAVGIKENIRLLGFALFCLLPLPTYMAHLINNDMAVCFLMTAVMYLTYLWYVSGKWRYALGVSGVLFLAGMIKFSGLMLVPAVGVVGLYRLLGASSQERKTVFAQGSVMALGAVSGFAHGLFLLYHHLPLVSPPINVDFQDLSRFTIWERLFSWQTIGEPLPDVWNGKVEINLILALFKTSLFGEWNWQGTGAVWTLYVLGGVLALALCVSFFSLLRYPLGQDYTFNLFVIVGVFAVLLSWINFALTFPYFCSVQFRYVAILWPMSFLWAENYLSQQKSLPKAVFYLLAGGTVVMFLAKVMLYLHTI
jgi:hypothetical protein